MSFSFRPAKRENVGLWVNIIGGTGSGKSFSALRLASGIANGKKFAFIDTENRRGLHYADQFDFDYAEITPPFRPEKFVEAVQAADKQGYPVIVIDSGSMIWSGDGGILDWQQEELERMGGGENQKMRSWIKPKMAHKQMVQKLLQVRAHIVMCLRAEEKIEMVKVGNKTEVRAKQSLTGINGWIPISDKALPFEATCSFLLMADKPGVPLPIKLQNQHREIFPEGKLIDEEAGKRLAEWANGGTPIDKVKDLAARRVELIEYFDKLGVSSERILAVVEKKAIADIDSDDLDVLRTIARGIKDQTATIAEAFPLDESDAERAAIESE